MTGLAFPTGSAFDHEPTHRYDSPVALHTNIPIDPALSGQVLDPAIAGERLNVDSLQVCICKYPDLRDA